MKFLKKFMKGLSLGILIIILFVSTLAILILTPVRNTIKKNSIKDMITNIEIEKLILNNPKVEEQLEEALAPIYDEAEKYGIPKDAIVKIVDSKEVKGFVGDITGNIMNYVVTGENSKLIDPSTVSNLISDTIDDINESGYYEISKEDKDNILKVVDTEMAKYEDYIPDTSVLDQNLPTSTKDSMNVLRFVLSNELITYLFVAMLVSFIGIVLIKWKKAKWIKWNGITILSAGSFMSIVSVILLIVNNLVIKDKIIYVYELLNKPFKSSLILSLSMVILMIVALVSYTIVMKKQNKKNAN